MGSVVIGAGCRGRGGHVGFGMGVVWGLGAGIDAGPQVTAGWSPQGAWVSSLWGVRVVWVGGTWVDGYEWV